MTEDFRFNEFRVYQLAKELHKEIFEFTKKFPRELEYLVNQIRRASLSVVLNIAEGSGKNSDKDFNRYIHNALGSVYEVTACLDVAKDLTRLNYESLMVRHYALRKQLGSFSKKLRADSWLRWSRGLPRDLCKPCFADDVNFHRARILQIRLNLIGNIASQFHRG